MHIGSLALWAALPTPHSARNLPPISPPDELDHVIKALKTDTNLDTELTEKLLSGPPPSCINIADDAEEAPPSCDMWSNAIRKHNLVGKVNELWAVSPPDWFPSHNDSESNPETEAEAFAGNSLEERGDKRMDAIWEAAKKNRVPVACQKCNEKKRLAMCAFAWTIVMAPFCVREQRLCCSYGHTDKESDCACLCKGAADCKARGMQYWAGPGYDWQIM